MQVFREFIVPYAENCRRRHRHKQSRGKILEFCIQLEVKYKEAWYVVVRYDTSRGYTHQDIIHADGKKEKIPLGISDYDEALTFAQMGLDTNWQIYKKRFYKEVRYYE